MGRGRGTVMKMKIGDEGLGEMGRWRGTAMKMNPEQIGEAKSR